MLKIFKLSILLSWIVFSLTNASNIESNSIEETSILRIISLDPLMLTHHSQVLIAAIKQFNPHAIHFCCSLSSPVACNILMIQELENFLFKTHHVMTFNEMGASYWTFIRGDFRVRVNHMSGVPVSHDELSLKRPSYSFNFTNDKIIDLHIDGELNPTTQSRDSSLEFVVYEQWESYKLFLTKYAIVENIKDLIHPGESSCGGNV